MNKIFISRELHNFGRYSPNDPLRYIHPYKTDALKKILENIPDWVEFIVIYGSSVSDYQTEESDLDLAVIPRDESFAFQKIIRGLKLPVKVDMQSFESLDDLLSQAEELFATPRDIVRAGVPVYAKGFNISAQI